VQITVLIIVTLKFIILINLITRLNIAINLLECITILINWFSYYYCGRLEMKVLIKYIFYTYMPNNISSIRPWPICLIPTYFLASRGNEHVRENLLIRIVIIIIINGMFRHPIIIIIVTRLRICNVKCHLKMNNRFIKRIMGNNIMCGSAACTYSEYIDIFFARATTNPHV